MKQKNRSVFPEQSKVWLHFSDGTSFNGRCNLQKNDERLKKGIWGEAAFTTAMSGYQETMTDPSYLGQHVIFTTAHVGNYSPHPLCNQSQKIHASSVIARNFSVNPFLGETDTPLVEGIDTRSLVRFLTGMSCSHKSVITNNHNPPSPSDFEQAKLYCDDLARVGQETMAVLKEGKNPVVIINYGIKKAIVEQFLAMDIPLVCLGHNANSEEIIKYHPRMIFLSNGPGNPKNYHKQIQTIRELLPLHIPLRGICLGHQLICLALGAKTIRLPFGQRGINHPVLNHENGQIIITSQNHGYAIDKESFAKIAKNNPAGPSLFIEYSSLFDHSIEGISSTDRFLRSVQFHPEANPGPGDGASFFTEIEEYLRSKPLNLHIGHHFPLVPMGTKRKIFWKKILLIGSGPIKIGQASEFDYSGTQACKVLKDLGVKVVLLNSNPATIMTDKEMAFRTYIEPITKEVIKKIIDKEKVDSIISTMGGQTALNLCIALEEEGFLKKRGITLLGANAWTIKHTEDRKLFAHELHKLGYKSSPYFDAHSPEEAVKIAAKKVGYPLIIRKDFTLGGKGAALIHNERELLEAFTADLELPISLERSLVGQKEIELEVMVDRQGNGVIICSIENIDPCGVHTGDSITVAPVQTISDKCYQRLRTMALTIARHMKIVAGGANIQFAIDPQDEDNITVIEMNPRVSRSSALASKATGYPIAKISTLLSVGYMLQEIPNDITKVSPVAFEPTLDYVAVKIPVFPFDKFPASSKILGPQMRSIGEVLALAGSFNEAFLKALRSTETGLEIPKISSLKNEPLAMTREYIKNRLKKPHAFCLLTVIEALRLQMSPDEIFDLSKISPWFIEQMEKIVKTEEEIKTTDIFENEKFFYYKSLGFSDKYLALLKHISQEEVYRYRHQKNIHPVYKAVDTCSGEFRAETPYFYSTYSRENEAFSLQEKKKTIAILGSGPNRIGQGIEFDYSCVKSCFHLREKGIQAIMINSNPETVSTDYDTSDRLYISPLYSEDLFDILINEKPEGVISCFSGQTGIKIRKYLKGSFWGLFHHFNFLGTSLNTLDLTEDRTLFDLVIKKTDLGQTKSMEIKGYKKMIDAMTKIGLPVIIRPSYVLGGESMYIFHSHDDIEQLPLEQKLQLKNSQSSFLVENYLENALEYDVDLICDRYGNTIFTICEHIEHAGVHSGDSGMVCPPIHLDKKLYRKMKDISIQLAKKLEIIGPINFQYAVKDNQIYCIEANPRGSRTLPFLSKACDIPLPQMATEAMLGGKIPSEKEISPSLFCIKQSTFPFDRFLQDNIILGPKMLSTGETMGIDPVMENALIKSYQGNYPNLTGSGKILVSLSNSCKDIILPYLSGLHDKGYEFYATKNTKEYIEKQGIPCLLVAKLGQDEGIDLLELLKKEKIKMVLNTPMNQGSSKSDGERIRNNAIQYSIPCFTRKENIKAILHALLSIDSDKLFPIDLQKIHAKEFSHV